MRAFFSNIAKLVAATATAIAVSGLFATNPILAIVVLAMFVMWAVPQVSPSGFCLWLGLTVMQIYASATEATWGVYRFIMLPGGQIEFPTTGKLQGLFSVTPQGLVVVSMIGALIFWGVTMALHKEKT